MVFLFEICVDYKNKDTRAALIAEIAKEFDYPEQAITDKIRNLRVQFIAEKKKEKNKKSGQDTASNYKSKWPFVDALNFLTASVVPTATSSNLVRFLEISSAKCNVLVIF